MPAFREHSALLGDPGALVRELRSEGYLFFRGLFPKDAVLRLRAAIDAICARHGIRAEAPVDEGSAGWIPYYEAVQKLELFHRFAHDYAPRQVLDALFAEETVVLPNKLLRLAYPGEGAYATPAHQDFVYIQGSADIITCWVPLGDVPSELGGLMLQPGSHKLGSLPMRQKPGGAYVLDPPDLPWASTDYLAGDAVFFHSMTVHASRPNRTGRLRFSTDFRYAGLSHAVSDENLLPHGGGKGHPFTWDNLDKDWDPAFRRYWERLPVKWVPHRPGFFTKS